MDSSVHGEDFLVATSFACNDFGVSECAIFPQPAEDLACLLEPCFLSNFKLPNGALQNEKSCVIPRHQDDFPIRCCCAVPKLEVAFKVPKLLPSLARRVEDNNCSVTPRRQDNFPIRCCCAVPKLEVASKVPKLLPSLARRVEDNNCSVTPRRQDDFPIKCC